ncbi:MAG: HAD hydrolase-like protein [Promethearchaeota archaeon]
MVKFSDISENLRNKRLFIFDFDETVVNLNLKWDELKENLSALVKERFNIKMTFTPIIEKLEELKSKISQDEFIPILNSLIQGEIHALKEYSTIQPVGFTLLTEIYKNYVENSKENCHIALLSNNYTETITLGAKQYGFDSYISYYVGRDMVKKIKPDVEGLKKIHENFSNIQKSEIIYFGDSAKYDKMVAESYGIDFYLIKYPE